jgi:putative transposase
VLAWRLSDTLYGSFCNADRPHTAIDKRTPDDAFFDTERTQKAA